MIKNTYLACRRSGMPYRHGQCFQRVSNQMNCMIACRSVGIYATGLISGNYASKGYHIKAKTCNWGPMAGFVVSDPRFSKKGIEGVKMQREAIHKAMLRGGSEIPLYITDQRRKELEVMGCMKRAGGTINQMIYSACPPGAGKVILFVLEREVIGVKGARGSQMWGVYYGRKEITMPSSFTASTMAPDKGSLFPVMALVDPQCAPAVRGSYRSAMTSDYDLWGIWPVVSEYNPDTLDRRSVPFSNKVPQTKQMFLQYGDPNLGNITCRGILVNNQLNNAIRASGYTGGNMVHHGDETGRPFVFDIEMEFIAFIPNQDGIARFVESIDDYHTLMYECIIDYSVSLNGSWQRVLGFSSTRRHSLERP